MTGEHDNPSTEGTDTAMPDETDTTLDWDYYDPDDDQDTGEDQEDVTDDDGTESEAEDTEEAEVEEETEDEGEEPETEDFIELTTGEKVSRDEAANGYLRQQDYTRKTQEVAERRKTLEAEAQRIDGITEALAENITGLLPGEPDANLARTNPGEYLAQKDRYERAIRFIEDIVTKGQEAKGAADNLTQQQRQEQVAVERQALGDKFPDTLTKEGNDKFFAAAAEAGQELGFSVDELNNVLDHRQFAALHWAKKGLEAEKAKAKAKEKVSKAPPSAPRKPGQNGKRANRNADAMRKLNRSGSIQDALAIDFD